jgi:hypothetical protein
LSKAAALSQRSVHNSDFGEFCMAKPLLAWQMVGTGIHKFSLVLALARYLDYIFSA